MSNPFFQIYSSDPYKNARNLPLSDFPFIVDVEPTNFCNLKCRMCPHNVMTRVKGYMEFEVFKKIVDECQENGAAIRLIRFGEHLLHNFIFKFIEYAKEKKVPVHMTTNGIFLDENVAKKLVDLKLDSIVFSMQGATKEGYRQMRNNDKYELLVENIKKLVEIKNHKKSIKPWIHVSSTMTNETKEEIEVFKNFWQGIVDSVGVGKTSFAQIDKDEYHEKIKDIAPKETIKKIYSPCSEVYQKLSVDWNGDVTACCGDYNGELVIGNVKDRSLKNIWNGDKLNKIREILDNMDMQKLPLCRECYHTYEEF